MVIGGDLSREVALDAGKALVDWSQDNAEVPLAGLHDTTDESMLNRERPTPPPGCGLRVVPDGSQELCLYSGGVSLGRFLLKPALLPVWAASVWVVVGLWLTSGLPLQPKPPSGVGMTLAAALSALVVGLLYYAQRRPRAITLTADEIRAAQGVRVPRGEVRAIRIGRRRDAAQPVLYAMLTGYRPRALYGGDVHTLQWAASTLREILGVPVLAEGGDRDDPLDPRWPAVEREWAPDGASFRTQEDGEGLQLERPGETESVGCLIAMSAGSLVAGLGCVGGALVMHEPDQHASYWVFAAMALGFAALMAFGVFHDRRKRERIVIGPESLTRQRISSSGTRTHTCRWSEIEDARAVAELEAMNHIRMRVVIRLRDRGEETLAEVKDPAEALFIATLVRRAWHGAAERAGAGAVAEASEEP